MKIYLAAPYSKKDQIRGYAEQLRNLGFVVTSSWLEEPHVPNTQMADLTPQEHQKYAMKDYDDVRDADIVVFFTDSTKTIVRGGRHVEFGLALAWGKLITVVGDEWENIFHHMPYVYHHPDWVTTLRFLNAISELGAEKSRYGR